MVEFIIRMISVVFWKQLETPVIMKWATNTSGVNQSFGGCRLVRTSLCMAADYTVHCLQV